MRLLNPKNEMKMISFKVRGKRLAEVRKPLPMPRPGWALIRVRLAGICNTDVEILRGYHAFHGTPGLAYTTSMPARTDSS